MNVIWRVYHDMVKIRFIKNAGDYKKGDIINCPKKDVEQIIKTGDAEYVKNEEKISSKSTATKALEIAGVDKQEAADIFTRIGQARNFIQNIPLFYDRAKLWWAWKNNSAPCWMMIDETDLLIMVRNTIGVHGVKAGEKSEILNALSQVSREMEPEKASDTWIQFSNGIVDVMAEDIKLQDPNPKYFISNPLAWKLGESDETPNMDKIFAEWVGGENKVQLYEILAYCMLPDYPIHRMFILLGGGLNGKSKFIQLLRKFIGDDNCSSTELDKLTGSNSRFEYTRFHKKLVCTMGETDFNEIQRTSVLKNLTGQDNISIEYKNKGHIDYVNYAKIIIATNNLPSTSDKTVGFYRRPIIIDFPNEFTEKKDILSEIPDIEYENLGRKCVGILKRLLTDRSFTNEGSIKDRMKRYEDRSNPFDKFWIENIIEDPDEFITLNQFKKKFEEWCKINKFRKMNDHEIGLKMKEKGIDKSAKNIEWFEGENKKRVTAKVWRDIKWRD
jgi:putative DNA primase/helicase